MKTNMIKVTGVGVEDLNSLINDTPWYVTDNNGTYFLYCELYDDRRGYPDEFWWDVADAVDSLNQIIRELPSGAIINGKCEFDAAGDPDIDHPEDAFGVIGTNGHEVYVRYGIRVFDPNDLVSGV